MNEDLLTRLSQIDVATHTPPLENIKCRARALSRARQARRVGFVAIGAGALVLGGVLLPPGSAPGPVAQGHPVANYLQLQSARAADSGGPDCNTGQGSSVDPAQWKSTPAIVRSASLITDPPFPLTQVRVNTEVMGCPPPTPAAVLYSTSPVRGVSVWADVKDPFAGVSDPITDVRVRGEAGRLREVNDSLFVSWLEPDGTRWFAMGSGQDTDQLVSILNELTFHDGKLDPATAPAGFVAAPIGAAPTSTTTLRWTVTYGDDPEVPFVGEGTPPPTAPRDEVTLEVTTSSAVPPQVVASASVSGVHFVDINGQQGIYTPWGDPKTSTGGWLKWQHAGLNYTLAADHGLDESTRLADRVEHVQLTDTRVTATIH